MTVLSELRKHRNELPERPEVPAEMKDTIEYQLGYRVGYRSAVDETIEIAEEAEDDG